MNDFTPNDGESLRPLRQHFPERCIGSELLRDFQTEDHTSLMRLLSQLIELQTNRTKRRGLHKPRVFISHRRDDEKLARRFAQIAVNQGFNFWLDVLDPNLQLLSKLPDPNPVRQALTTAILIEMALLNCTHVLAVITRRTAGSLWVPYEYGRVKCANLFGVEAAAWVNRGLYQSNAYAEYLRLGAIHRAKLSVERWMQTELHRWKRSSGGRGSSGHSP